ncbi:MAG: hypothetical protein ABFS56_30855 [Pseudomonadota bacterium]
MPHLVNKANQETLLESLQHAIQDTAKNKKREFYAVTCYFDSEAVKTLASCINDALKNTQGTLIGFYIYVDIGDWIKCRENKDELIQNIHDLTKLDHDKIDFIPIDFKNRLFHAKIYGLVSRKNKRDGKRNGFVAISSGNLTKRGLGSVKDKSNIEVVQIVKESHSIEEYMKIIQELKNFSASEERLKRQEDFILAFRLFSAGHFYHKWEGNLSSEVRFKLTLTETGKEKLQKDVFKNYRKDSNSISRVPINLQNIFKEIPKPFPQHFWRLYSVDTLLGRWIPAGVASLVDKALEKEVKPYIKEIYNLITKQLEAKTDELSEEVEKYQKEGYVNEDVKVVKTWSKKIKTFPENNKGLITLRIYNYEKIPEILDDANRKLILKTFEQLCNQLQMHKQRGVKAVLGKAIKEYDARVFEEELKTLTENAEKELAKHNKKR